MLAQMMKPRNAKAITATTQAMRTSREPPQMRKDLRRLRVFPFLLNGVPHPPNGLDEFGLSAGLVHLFP